MGVSSRVVDSIDRGISLITFSFPSLGLTQKSLQRLFPCDTSMVVIIDDRADVWEWSPNLIKVIPCELIFPLCVQFSTSDR